LPGRSEPVGRQDDAGALADPEGPVDKADAIDGQDDPPAAMAGAAGLLGHGRGDLDAPRLAGPADEDTLPDRGRPHRRRGRSGGQQGPEDEHADDRVAAGVVPDAGRAGRRQARHDETAGRGDPRGRSREPGTENDPGRGGRRQRHPVRVGVGVGVAPTERREALTDRPTATTRRATIGPQRAAASGEPAVAAADREAGAADRRVGAAKRRVATVKRATATADRRGSHPTVTRSFSWSKRRWPMPGTSRSSSTLVKGWAER
jgi:hypothetical protein